MEVQLVSPPPPAIEKYQTESRIKNEIAAKAQEAQVSLGQTAVDLVKQVEELAAQLAEGYVDIQI
ncbi:MAG: hypothetical protein KDB03_03910 [Planctomycetales bacterium]|nr:hypothetical protein [Planctomycetales bacterium]